MPLRTLAARLPGPITEPGLVAGSRCSAGRPRAGRGRLPARTATLADAPVAFSHEDKAACRVRWLARAQDVSYPSGHAR